MSRLGFTSKLLHADRRGGVEHGSIHKPIHTAVTYGYDDAHELAAVFQGREAPNACSVKLFIWSNSFRFYRSLGLFKVAS